MGISLFPMSVAESVSAERDDCCNMVNARTKHHEFSSQNPGIGLKIILPTEATQDAGTMLFYSSHKTLPFAIITNILGFRS